MYSLTRHKLLHCPGIFQDLDNKRKVSVCPRLSKWGISCKRCLVIFPETHVAVKGFPWMKADHIMWNLQLQSDGEREWFYFCPMHSGVEAQCWFLEMYTESAGPWEWQSPGFQLCAGLETASVCEHLCVGVPWGSAERILGKPNERSCSTWK